MREKFAAAAKHLVLLPPGRHDSSHPFDRMIARRRVRAPTSAGWALPALARGALSFPRESSEVRLLEALLRGDRFVYVTGAAGSGKSHVVATVLERLGRSRNAGLFSNVLHVNCGGTNAGDLACGAHCETRFLVLLAAALLMDSDARALFAWLDGATNDACAAAARDALRASVDAVKRRHRRVLLFLDGVDNTTGAVACPLFDVVRRYLFGEGGEADGHITGLLVACPNVSVVMTSRGLGHVMTPTGLTQVRGVPVLGLVTPALLQFSGDIDVTGMAPEDVSRFWAHVADCAPDELDAWFGTRGTSRVELDRLLSTEGKGRVFVVGPLSRAAALLRLASCRQAWAHDYLRAGSPDILAVVPSPRMLCRDGRLSDRCADAYERAYAALDVERLREAHLGFWSHVEGGPDAIREIHDWIAGAGAVGGSRVFVLHGPAARGKTAAVAALASRTLHDVSVTAVHFLQSYNRATWDVRQMILSIAHQLRAKRGDSKDIDALPPPSDVPPTASWCCTVLKDALGSGPRERGCMSLIVVDGADDTSCGGAADQRALLSILAVVVSELPAWVRLLVTCRSPEVATQILIDATVSTSWSQQKVASAFVADLRSRFDGVRAREPTLAMQTMLKVLGEAEAPLEVCAALRAAASRRHLPAWDDGAGALATLESNNLFRVRRDDTWLVEPCSSAVYEWTRDISKSAREELCGFLERCPTGDEQLLVAEDDPDAYYIREHFSLCRRTAALKFNSDSGEEGIIDLHGALVRDEDPAGMWFRVYTSERVLDLRAVDRAAKKCWVDALKDAAVVALPTQCPLLSILCAFWTWTYQVLLHRLVGMGLARKSCAWRCSPFTRPVCVK